MAGQIGSNYENGIATSNRMNSTLQNSCIFFEPNAQTLTVRARVNFVMYTSSAGSMHAQINFD